MGYEEAVAAATTIVGNLPYPPASPRVSVTVAGQKMVELQVDLQVNYSRKMYVERTKQSS